MCDLVKHSCRPARVGRDAKVKSVIALPAGARRSAATSARACACGARTRRRRSPRERGRGGAQTRARVHLGGQRAPSARRRAGRCAGTAQQTLRRHCWPLSGYLNQTKRAAVQVCAVSRPAGTRSPPHATAAQRARAARREREPMFKRVGALAAAPSASACDVGASWSKRCACERRPERSRMRSRASRRGARRARAPTAGLRPRCHATRALRGRAAPPRIRVAAAAARSRGAPVERGWGATTMRARRMITDIACPRNSTTSRAAPRRAESYHPALRARAPRALVAELVVGREDGSKRAASSAACASSPSRAPARSASPFTSGPRRKWSRLSRPVRAGASARGARLLPPCYLVNASDSGCTTILAGCPGASSIALPPSRSRPKFLRARRRGGARAYGARTFPPAHVVGGLLPVGAGRRGVPSHHHPARHLLARLRARPTHSWPRARLAVALNSKSTGRFHRLQNAFSRQNF